MRLPRLRRLLPLAALPVLAAGCVGLVVPRTVVEGTVGGQPFRLVSPKDSELKGLTVTAATNGVVSIRLESLTTRMNPEVITGSSQGQVDIINALSGAIQNAAAAGAKGAAK